MLTASGGVHIYGAGMAGLLGATMLRHAQPFVHEQQAGLPDNHGALLRFRSRAVEQETGQTFHCVSVLKAIKSNDQLLERCSLRDANLYSKKVSGVVSARSVINLAPCERFIAPPDFLSVMARNTHLTLKDGLTMERIQEHHKAGDSIISTIPMPALMRIVGWQAPEFKWRPIWSLVVDVPTDVHQTIYYPGDEPYYRASITGSELIIEFTQEVEAAVAHIASVLSDFGIASNAIGGLKIKRQEYGKLISISDDERQRFILHMTDQYRVYSIGRFATWRQILLDDVVGDIKQVSRWIKQRTNYERRLEVNR